MINDAEEFVKLRTSTIPDEYHRAAHDAAPDRVWLEIINKYPEMRRWVAHNKTVSGDILALLDNDLDSRVRRMVADRRAAGEEILMKLASDPDETVRHRVAFNPKVTKDILKKLLTDEWENIREIAAKKLAELE